MKIRIIIIVLALMLAYGLYSQKPILKLIFTSVDSANNVQIDSIKVMNRTQGNDTVLYYPDTILVLDFLTGIHNVEMEDVGFEVFQNYPNPLKDQTTISLYVPEKDRLILVVSDMLGKVILKTETILEKGLHSFRFTPGRGNLFFFTAQWRGHSSSIKILFTGAFTTGTVSLEYTGSEHPPQYLKVVAAIQEFSFSPGDELLYIGYADTLQSGMLDSPEQSQIYTFQFATNIPCPGTPTITYEGQVYNTIQIFSQCWLKENLNVGTMVPGNQNQLNNGIIEKYCYVDDNSNCNLYGGFYQWSEMMQYTTQLGAQGICPPGWHVPTDEEWKVLEGTVDNQYAIGDTTWDGYGFRGYDAGTNLKSASSWFENGNGTDLFGFSGQPSGLRFIYGGGFLGLGINGYWWPSTEYDSATAWYRSVTYCYPGVYRNISSGLSKAYGLSVRCLRDE
jgi:uncharacterized protein (TIGR02145 family)